MKGKNKKHAGHYAPLLSAALLAFLAAGCSTQAGSSLSATEGGYVVVQFCIGKSGSVNHVRVMESSPPGKFDATAMYIARNWEFRPAMFVGVPAQECGVREKIAFNAAGQVESVSNLGERTTNDRDQ